MKKLCILFLSFVLITACNNNTPGTETTKKAQGDTSGAAAGGDSDTGTQYKWTATEQKKFMDDCQRESSEHIAKGKLNDFCACMLTESQKYYSSYKQMDEKSDEDNDEEIFKKCVGTYGENTEQ